nr:PREDICTED: AT-rich interactive domain-containing protein 4B [Lepisosteus oculatus]XP_015218295.1 PREDICTED: AT-rich interactive domain-containing protein 4B [Lepisosteus oculatus]
MKTLEEPPYLTVGTDVSAKYRGAFCEAKIKTAKRLVRVKVTFKQEASTAEVQDEHIRGPLKVGATVEVKTQDGTYQEAIINKLTDASWYTVVFDDGDEKTLRRSSLCLKGERHFAESETLDQLPLTNPEHFGTPVIGKKSNRGRRSNHVPEEEETSSSSEEEEGDGRVGDELLGKVVCVECAAAEKKKASWYPALVISPDCNDEVVMKKDTILVRSFKDGKFHVVLRKDVREMNCESAPKPEAGMKPALDGALEFLRRGVVPASWRTELKEESSSGEEQEEEEEEQEDDGSSEEEEEEVEPFPEERDSFLQQLYKFMEDRGTPINKRPVLGYRNLNLFKLYRLVHRLGGFDNIDSGSVWKQVYQDLGIPVLNSAAGYNVKCAYRKYLYGFEEYCKSTGIAFQMALPQKQAEKPCLEPGGKAGSPVTHPAAPIAGTQAEPLEDEEEEEEEELRAECEQCGGDAHPAVSRVDKMSDQGLLGSTDLETGALKTEAEEEKQEEEEEDEEEGEVVEPPQTENVKNEPYEELEDKDKSGDESSKEREGEEFECYPPGMKVQVRYGRGRNQKMYEATVKESDLDGGEVLYLVHYCGWNVRYDEWIKADKIVRPADKNVPKIKHRKKIKNKTEREKDKTERPDREDLSPVKYGRIRRSSKSSVNSTPSDSFSKLESSDPKGADQSPVKPIEITSILNGLQASESSAEESEREDEEEEDDEDEDEDVEEEEEEERLGNGSPPKSSSRDSTLGVERWEAEPRRDSCRTSAEKDEEPGRLPGSKDCAVDDTPKYRGGLDSEGEDGPKRRAEGLTERSPKPQLKGKLRNSRPADWLQTGSPKRQEDRGPGEGGSPSSSSSSSDDEDDEPHPAERDREEERAKPKGTPSKNYNGLDEKRKSGRPAPFWEVPEKRPKLTGSSEERLPSSRASKGQKDVWSSIQAQWPKKTLKELFSDSDTEAANSPPPVPAPEEPRPEPAAEEPEPCEGKAEERAGKTREFPSSGSNSVLNTPPTTPESPSLGVSAVEPPGRTRTAASPPPPPPLASALAPHGSPLAPRGPVREESVGGRSETDSSTVEVESLGGELQELPPEEQGSPAAFDGCLSSHSSSNSSHSGSSHLESDHREKATTSQKRPKEAQAGGTTKKHKRSHKNSGVHHKKSRKAGVAHSSDSEDQSTSEITAKSLTAKAPSGLKPAVPAKCPSRMPAPGKCHRQTDPEHKEHPSRSPRVYKWSFQMSELEKMSSLERIAFLQEKLQDIRNHYLSLKSEVASIDRRRKRLKKKERESAAAASSSSSSSSPSSSSLTAAVMLTLAEPPVPGASQGSGVSVECR